MKKLVFAAGLALAALSTTASAQGHGFVRGEVGRSNIDIRADDIGSGDEGDTSWGVRGGYWFNPNVALEGFYSQFYSQSFEGDRVKLHGVGLGVAAKKNFGGEHQGFFVGGRLGVARGVATVEYDDEVDGAASSAKPYYGVAVGYDFNPKFGLSLNYDRFKAGEEGVDITAKTLTLGLEARF